MDSYWFGSGTPTYLIEMLNKFDVLPSTIGGEEVLPSDFDAPTERWENATPLLYQSGYVTIKNHDKETDLYLLDMPNQEVRIGLDAQLAAQLCGTVHAERQHDDSQDVGSHS